MRTSPHAVSTEICGVVPKVGGVTGVVGIEGGVVSVNRGARKRSPDPSRRRDLEPLAASPDGCTEAIMLAHGFGSTCCSI